MIPAIRRRFLARKRRRIVMDDPQILDGDALQQTCNFKSSEARFYDGPTFYQRLFIEVCRWHSISGSISINWQ